MLVLGPRDLAVGTSGHASEMYSRNVTALIQHLVADGELAIDLDDPITAAVCVAHAGQIAPALRATLPGTS